MSHQRRITEENQSSITLNDNTLIQEYNNLDYSDEMEDMASSEEHSLSRSHHQQLRKMDEIIKINKNDHEQNQRERANRQNHVRQISRQQFKDIESKYDLGISPSTKEEYSLLNPTSNQVRKSNPKHVRAGSNLPNIDSDQYQQMDYYQENYQNNDEQIEESYKQCGREAKMGKKNKKQNNVNSFNIDNFLNAAPVAAKGKKGLNVLQQHYPKQMKQKYQINNSKVIHEEESINLVTLPEIDVSYHKKINKAIKKNQDQIQKINQSYQRRFDQVRLNFIDSFMPDSLKIKSNPFALLKYITNKQNYF